ncbi:LysE family transporter [Rhizobium ruizarguesonis]
MTCGANDQGPQIWKGTAQPVDAQAAQQSTRSGLQSFRGALLTRLSNPKAIVGYTSFFAAFPLKGYQQNLRCRYHSAFLQPKPDVR